MRSGIFMAVDGTEYLYFGDPVTKKKLTFFSMDGALVRSVDLTRAKAAIGDAIGGISVVAWDTIVMNSRKGEELAFIDSTGEVFKLINLEPWLHNDRGDRFDLGNSGDMGPWVDGNFIFVTDWTSNDTDELHHSTPLFGDRLTFSRYYNGHRAVAPHLARITLQGVTPQVTWGMDSFYYHMREDHWRIAELPRFGYAFGKLLVYSIYSPDIQVVDPVLFTTTASWQVRSHLTPTFISPPTLDENEVRDKEALNRRLRTGGCIYKVVGDKVTGHYLVAVRHADPGQALRKEAAYVPRPMSIMEFDGNFQLVREVVYDDGSYMFGAMFPTSKGILVLRTKQGPGGFVFDRFDLNGD
ncbi:MAG: hypothetical protein M9900_02640 [Flavobacteriales bacterium]|nr:hypothetical protein [Flavobacteriales bacterium]HRP82135.1 hypothetical protein [Flavobacteriales bacterium]